MKNAPGIPLGQVWSTMDIEARLAVVKTIIGYQKAWASVSFCKYGSLYFSTDLDKTNHSGPLYVDANGAKVQDGKFVVGPSTGRKTIDGGRMNVSFDRGPCKNFTCLECTY